MIKHITTTPAKALEKLKAGNARYIDDMYPVFWTPLKI